MTLLNSPCGLCSCSIKMNRTRESKKGNNRFIFNCRTGPGPTVRFRKERKGIANARDDLTQKLEETRELLREDDTMTVGRS